VSDTEFNSDELQARLESVRAGSDYQTEQLIDAITESVIDRMFELQLTRAQLAERLGVSPARVTNLLRGANFTVRTLAEIGSALGCDVSLGFEPRAQGANPKATGAEVAAESRAAYRTRRTATGNASRDGEIREHLASGKLKVERGVVYMWRERKQAYALATFRATHGREDILRTNVGSRAYYKDRILAVADTVAPPVRRVKP
jgi:transcriptional regulator with XRE-family HTH domain